MGQYESTTPDQNNNDDNREEIPKYRQPHVPAPLKGDISTLKKSLKGNVYLPGEPEYDQQRQNIWNKSAAGYPSAIVSISKNCVEDVVAVVNYARENECLLSIAGGRHSTLCMLNDSLMLDMANYDKLQVDPEKKILVAGAGVKLGALDAECAKYGLATVAGHNPDTGIAGLTLGGGLGFLSRKYGLTIDNIIQFEVVLASGVTAIANETSNEDLFWALRGGGGNFGVVTEFTLRLHPIPEKILAGTRVFLDIPLISGNLLSHPLAIAKKVGPLIEQAPDEVSVILVFPIGGPFVISWSYCGTPEQGAEELKKLTNCGTGLGSIGPASYHFDVQQSALGPKKDRQQPGFYFEKGVLLESTSPEFFEELWKARSAVLPAGSTGAVVLMSCGGAVGRIPKEATAYVHRNARWWVLIMAETKDPDNYAGMKANEAWVRKTHGALSKFGIGSYAPVIQAEQGSSQTLERVFGDNLPKLEAAKKKYDPINLFRANRNIRSYDHTDD